MQCFGLGFQGARSFGYMSCGHLFERADCSCNAPFSYFAVAGSWTSAAPHLCAMPSATIYASASAVIIGFTPANV